MKKLPWLLLVSSLPLSAQEIPQKSPLLGKWIFVAVAESGETVSSPVIHFNVDYGTSVYEIKYLQPFGVLQTVGCVVEIEEDEWECYSDAFPPPFNEFYLKLHQTVVAYGKTEDGDLIYGWRIERARMK